ncbi:response regulator [Aureimonas psammosilenae]|uniref:response regulator n=1 Tax=Aureimonas psammosilenae TaxID=2495496 RepID=UPI001261298D|nr:response regulator [Aureimonas psammosilenae]
MSEVEGHMRGRRILIVEDDYYIIEEMVGDFEALGAVVVGPAARADDALDIIEKEGPLDGAVLDINLQGEMVYPVADALKRRGVPFVFATGYDHGSVAPDYQDVIVCEKPVRPIAICEALFG